MPLQIPLGDARILPATPRVSRQSVQSGGQVFGQAAGLANNVSTAVAQLDEIVGEAERNVELHEKLSSAQLLLNDWSIKRLSLQGKDDEGRDYHETIIDDFDTFKQDLTESLADGITHEGQSEDLQLGLMRLFTSTGTQLQSAANGQRIDKLRASTDASLINYRQLTADDPSKTDFFMAEATRLIESQVQTGAIDRETGGNLLRDWLDDVSNDQIRKTLIDNPHQAAAMLGDASQLRHLNQNSRITLLDTAIRRADQMDRQEIATAEKIERLQERELKEIQELNFGNVISGLRKEEVKSDDIETLRSMRGLSSVQYRTAVAYMDAVNEQGGIDDPEIARELKISAYKGQLEYGEAINAATEKDISTDTLGSLGDIIKAGLPFVSTPEYKAAYQSLAQAFGAPGGIGSIDGFRFDDATAIRFSRATEELFTRSLKGESPLEVSRDLRKRFVEDHLSDPGTIAKSTETPRFPTPDATYDAWQDGKLSDGQFSTQMDIFERNPDLLPKKPDPFPETEHQGTVERR